MLLTPAVRYEGEVLADPVHTPYPGADLEGYIWATSAQTWVDPVAREIERRGGPYPVRIEIVSGYTWGLDLRLNERRRRLGVGATTSSPPGRPGTRRTRAT